MAVLYTGRVIVCLCLFVLLACTCSAGLILRDVLNRLYQIHWVILSLRSIRYSVLHFLSGWWNLPRWILGNQHQHCPCPHDNGRLSTGELCNRLLLNMCRRLVQDCLKTYIQQTYFLGWPMYHHHIAGTVYRKWYSMSYIWFRLTFPPWLKKNRKVFSFFQTLHQLY